MLIYADTYNFTGADRSGSPFMVDKHLYPYGSQDQKYPKRSGCGDRRHLAATGIWSFELVKKLAGVNSGQFVTRIVKK
jgi:hypothetical protein